MPAPCCGHKEWRFSLVQFEAALLAVYLHNNQQQFTSVPSRVCWEFLLARPFYQQEPNPFCDDVFQELFVAAEERAALATEEDDDDEGPYG